MKILIGVTGGIAAYKACELVRLVAKAGHDVRVMMTTNGARFVGPTTFEALTHHPVLTDNFSDALAHIEWAKWPDVVCVAPLTANTLAKLACGLADDALTTGVMATPRGTPVVLGPAMNTEMWAHPATLRNRRWLEEMGRYTLVEPTEKQLACGDVGPGGLADPTDLFAAIKRSVHSA